MLTANTLEKTMNSWRLSLLICPVRVRKSIAAAHSGLGRLDLTDKGVCVLDQGRHCLTQPRMGISLEHLSAISVSVSSVT